MFSKPTQSAGNSEPAIAEDPVPAITNPMTKTGVLEITVYDLSNSRDDLALALSRFQGDIVSEKFEDQNGARRRLVYCGVVFT